MNRTAPQILENAITVPEKTAQQMLGCGLASTRRIGKEAGARIKVGSRVLYRVDRLRAYIEALSEEQA